ncbi:hypothetical protein GGR08_001524, partial [Bartonella fuyuanensis]|nr:hypothetical protein [Bartonella fuyuanensis]
GVRYFFKVTSSLRNFTSYVFINFRIQFFKLFILLVEFSDEDVLLIFPIFKDMLYFSNTYPFFL